MPGFSEDDPARRVGVAWRELRRGASAQRLRAILYGPDADLGEIDALDVLAELGGCRMSELAGALRVDASTATRAVARLVDRGVARRTTAAGDRRAVMVELTARGRRRHEQLVDRRHAVLGRVFDEFDREELEQLAGLLERLIAAADRVVEESEPDASGAA
jgi:DNA-binding MarR family transcriptional regulator